MTLYAAYACNEGSGSAILDYSGNGRNMTISGTGNTWVTGHSPYALAFLGGSATGAGADWNGGSADSTLAGDVTVMCWAQSANGATGQSFAAGLYSAAGTARLAMYSYRSLNSTAASPELTVRNSAGGLFSLGVNGSTADANWHHIAAVYHSAGTVDIYLDGTEVVTAANVTSAIGTTVQYLGVGALLPGAGANSAVQDFRVFSSALASADITTYMNTPVAALPGAAALSGQGALTPAGQKTVPGAASFSGQGALSGAAQETVPGGAVFAGQGMLTASGTKTVPGGASLSGDGSLTAAGRKTVPGAVAMTAAGAAAVSAVTVRAAAAGMHALPSLAAASQAVREAAAGFSAAAAASAAAKVARAGTSALSGAASLSGVPGVSRAAAAGLSASPAVSAAARVTSQAGAGLSAVSRLSVTGGHQQAPEHQDVNASAAFSAFPALTCFPLSARIVMAANTMFPANQTGTYGTTEAETTVTVPGITDGIYA